MKNGDSLLGMFGWLTIGFLVAMLALLSLFGGVILVGLLVVGGIFLFGLLTLGELFGKQPVYITSFKVEEEAPVRREALSVAPPARVLIERVYT